MLGEPQIIGALGSGVASSMANLVNANRLVRKVQEKVAGISSEFPLPPLARETFSRWRNKNPADEASGDAGEVVLFATCYGEFNAPNVPIAAVKVLEHNGLRVLLPGEAEKAGRIPTCCGMPNLDGGDIAGAREKIRANVALLIADARAGRARSSSRARPAVTR